MARKSELTGIVRPDVDRRALERNVEQPMSRALDRVSNITPSLNLRGFRRQLMRTIPGGGLLSRGGGGGGGRGGGLDNDIQIAQLAKLEEIHDELQKGNVTAAQSGGGGGGGGSLIGTGLQLRGLQSILGGGGTSGGILSRLMGLGGTPGFVPVGIGSKFTQEDTNRAEQIARPIRRRLFGSDEPPLQNLQLPELPDFGSIEIPELPELGSMEWPELPDLGTMDWPELPDLSQQVEWPEPPDFGSIDAPPWLDQLERALDGSIEVDLGSLDASFDVQGDIRNLQRDIENAVEGFEENVIDAAVEAIRDEVTGLGV